MDATPIHTVSGIASGEASVRSGLGSGKVRSCVRRARILDIRAEIKAGTFLTPERMDGIVERLLDILG
jgi:hypothetical protein